MPTKEANGILRAGAGRIDAATKDALPLPLLDPGSERRHQDGRHQKAGGGWLEEVLQP